MEEKIQRTFVRKEAYLKIRSWILDGSLAPGEKLRDKDLADSLGTSRTPIREALLQLEEEGFVQTKPNRSTHIAPINFDDARHLYSIVWTLEALAMEEAFPHIDETHLQKMSAANEHFLVSMKMGDRLAALLADQEFHGGYIELSQNVELAKIIAQVKAKLTRIDLYYFDKIVDADRSYKEHQAIIAALQKQDLAKAIETTQSNWQNSFSRFRG